MGEIGLVAGIQMHFSTAIFALKTSAVNHGHKVCWRSKIDTPLSLNAYFFSIRIAIQVASAMDAAPSASMRGLSQYPERSNQNRVNPIINR